jgi:hypothetical protein
MDRVDVDGARVRDLSRAVYRRLDLLVEKAVVRIVIAMALLRVCGYRPSGIAYFVWSRASHLAVRGASSDPKPS